MSKVGDFSVFKKTKFRDSALEYVVFLVALISSFLTATLGVVRFFKHSPVGFLSKEGQFGRLILYIVLN